jgi:hypothetical protein
LVVLVLQHVFFLLPQQFILVAEAERHLEIIQQLADLVVRVEQAAVVLVELLLVVMQAQQDQLTLEAAEVAEEIKVNLMVVLVAAE